MKKILKILTTLTVVTSAPLIIVACSNNKIDNGINLNSIIKNTNLFTIKTYGARVPTIVEIIDTVKKLNTNPNIDWSKITIDENAITNTGAQLISTDTKVYHGNVAIKYTIDASIDLNSIIKNTNLNLISINVHDEKAKFSTLLKNQILNKIKSLNPDKAIDWSKITIDENAITNTGAQLISTDTTIYYDVVNITFTVNITNNNLNYKDDKSFNGTDSNEKGLSSEILLFKNWNYYSNNWANFIQNFTKITFANDSYLEVSSQYYKSKLSASQLNFNTNQIPDTFKDINIGWDPDDDNPNGGFVITDAASIWHVMTPIHDGGAFGALVQIGCYFMIYHDDKNIYLKYHWFERSLWATQGSHLDIHLTTFLIS